eukprot:1354621-Amorphochlora_amoeboformis.AAC.1
MVTIRHLFSLLCVSLQLSNLSPLSPSLSLSPALQKNNKLSLFKVILPETAGENTRPPRALRARDR